MNKRVLKVLERLEGERGKFWNVPRSTAEFLTLNVGPTFNVKNKQMAEQWGKEGFEFLGKLKKSDINYFSCWLQQVNNCRSTLNVAPTFNVEVLEIGTSNGYSGIWLAAVLQEMGRGKLVTVESNAARFELARANFLEAGVSDFVVQVKGHAPEVFEGEEFEEALRELGVESGEAARGAPGEVFDLIFVDSTKMEYVSYLEFVLPMLRSGGMLVADNCVSHREELGEFFDELEKRRGWGEIDYFLLELDSGLMLVTKCSPGL